MPNPSIKKYRPVRSKKSTKKRKTFNVKNFVIASPAFIDNTQNATYQMLLSETDRIAKKVRKAVMSNKTVNVSSNEAANLNVNTVHMLNSKHIITELTPQANAYTKWSVIRKFLSNGFDGEIIHKSDQQIIDQFQKLPDEEKQDEISKLKKLAFKFGE